MWQETPRRRRIPNPAEPPTTTGTSNHSPRRFVRTRTDATEKGEDGGSYNVDGHGGDGDGKCKTDDALLSRDKVVRDIQGELARRLGGSAVVVVGPQKKALMRRCVKVSQGHILLDVDLKKFNPSPAMRQAQIRTAERRGYIGCFPMFTYSVDDRLDVTLSIYRYLVESEAFEIAHSKVLDAFHEICVSMRMDLKGVRGGGMSIGGPVVIELDYELARAFPSRFPRTPGLDWDGARQREREARQEWTESQVARPK